MNNFYPAATVVLSEICLALLVLSGVMIFMMLRNKRRNQTALSQLTEKLKQNESERLAALKTMLKDIYQYAEDKIDESAAGIINAEMVFYQGLMNVFSSRDGASLENFDQKITPVIDAYRNLVPHTNPSAHEGDGTITHNGDAETLKDEMAQLKEENEKLANEMHAIKAAMEETNSEFTRAFAGRIKNDAKKELPVDQSAITADNPQDTTPDIKETEPAKADSNAEPPPAPSPAEGNDDDENILKNIDIDLGDIDLDENKEDTKNNGSPPSNDEKSNKVVATGSEAGKKPADVAPNKAAPTPDNIQKKIDPTTAPIPAKAKAK